MARRYLLLAVITVAGVLAAGCSSAESVVQRGYNFSKIDKTAVLDVSGHVSGAAARDQICDYFVMELMRAGYVVIERQKMQTILAEQKLQRSSLTTNAGAAQAGKILNVPAVVIGTVHVDGENISMTVKMIDVETTAIAWMATGKGSTRKTLATVGGAAVGAGVGVAVGTTGKGRTIGGAAGGVLGGVAGNAIAPEVDTVIRKIVTKIGKTIPAK